jgi:hypothetical protein
MSERVAAPFRPVHRNAVPDTHLGIAQSPESSIEHRPVMCRTRRVKFFARPGTPDATLVAPEYDGPSMPRYARPGVVRTAPKTGRHDMSLG